MKQRHALEFDLFILFLMGTLIAVMMWWAGLYSVDASTAILVMMVLGMATGLLIPSILVTWLIIGLTTIGCAILLFGYVVMPFSLKLALLLAFPICAIFDVIIRHRLARWLWIDRDRQAVESYVEHYDPATKLLTKYNAAKRYAKEIEFIKEDFQGNLSMYVTAIHLAHGNQLRQFHAHEYDRTVKEIAGVLKKYRLPSEALFYMDNATFLIISHNFSREAYDYQNHLTRDHLADLKIMGSTPQLKWGAKRVDRKSAATFPELHDVMRHIGRDMETDMVVEYLKEDD